MFKSKLQEVCQKQKWPLPKYSHKYFGLDNIACFTATVQVNGFTFETPWEWRTITEAHDSAAVVALRAISSTGGNIIIDPASLLTHFDESGEDYAKPFVMSSSNQGNHLTYKSKLHNYAQRKRLELPRYTTIRNCDSVFLRCSVTINGQEFRGGFFRSIREAEHSAAEEALANLPKEEEPPKKNSSDGASASSDCIMQENFKNMLQEALQKRKKALPKYSTVKDPDSIVPIFYSTVSMEGLNVSMEGLSFRGENCKSKKQAEASATKMALEYLATRNDKPALTESSKLVPVKGTEESAEIRSTESKSIMSGDQTKKT